MRSFRRSSKKNEPDDHNVSFSSTIDSKQSFEVPHINPSASYATSTTPVSSPVVYQSTQFTPPQPHNNNHNLSSSTSSTNLSSPKKLLTPIRNLFSSSSSTSSSNHKSSSNIAATNDSLHNAIYSHSSTTPSTSSKQNQSPAQLSSSSKNSRSSFTRSHKRGNNSISSLQPIELEQPLQVSFSHSQSQVSLSEYNKKGFSHSKGTIFNPNAQSVVNDLLPKNLPPPTQPFHTANKPINTTKLGSQVSLVSQSASFHSSGSQSLASQSINMSQLSQTQSGTATTSASTSLKPPLMINTEKISRNTVYEANDHNDDSFLDSNESFSRDLNDSDLSLAKSESKFTTRTTRKVSFKRRAEVFKSPSSETAAGTGTTEDQGFSDSASASDSDSSSSQFSFVKDMKGGRNTSVKYYKKNVSLNQNQKKMNTFNQNDLNYEVDEYSDYDFENNGMDDDFDDNDGEDDVNYNNAFDDDDGGENLAYENNDNAKVHNYDGISDLEEEEHQSDNIDENNASSEDFPEDDDEDEIENKYLDFDDNSIQFDKETSEGDREFVGPNRRETSTPTNSAVVEVDTNVRTPISDNNRNVRSKFNHSYHISIQGDDSSRQGSNESIQESDINADDILESYLDRSNSPSTSKNGSSSNTQQSSHSPEPFPHRQYDPENDKTDNLDHLYDGDRYVLNTDLSESNSPLINGVTVGSNLRHRLGRPNTSKDNIIGSMANGSNQYNTYDDHGSVNANTFIHRKQSDFDENAPMLSEKELYHNRAYKSFHGSISDNFDNILSNKLIEHEKFQTQRNNPSDKTMSNTETGNELGLGIAATSEPEVTTSNTEKKVVRASVNDMMNLLQQFNEDTKVKETGLKQDKNESSSNPDPETTKRNSIMNLMTLLEKVEVEKPPSDLKDKQRNSIAGVMTLLESLEGGISQEKASMISSISRQIEDVDKEKNSNTLALLTEEKEPVPFQKQKSNPNRKSINDMMSILASFDMGTKEVEEDEERKKKRISQRAENISTTPSRSLDKIQSQPKTYNSVSNKKRYSWFNDDESSNFNMTGSTGKGGSSGLRNEVTEEIKSNSTTFVFDESIIDEINQLPEDFDFEEYQNTINENNSTGNLSIPGFQRSNSYNNKPLRISIDNKAQLNKIETLNKTVTFYRSNSPQYLDLNRSRSISRAPSTRSNNSFLSINEADDDIDEEVKPAYPQSGHIADTKETSSVERNKVFSWNPVPTEEDLKSPIRKFTFENKSNESISRNPKFLGTITEAESPSLR